MKTLPDRKLTKNFSLYEFIEGQLPPQAIELNWRHLNEMDLAKIEQAAQHAQTIRDLINQEFKSDLSHKEIGLRITSGFRCRAWELAQGRSGNSQHTIAAYDCQPTNCSNEQAVGILAWLHNRFKRTYVGGLAIKKPTVEKGKYTKVGFIHFDFRGHVARWEY